MRYLGLEVCVGLTRCSDKLDKCGVENYFTVDPDLDVAGFTESRTVTW